MEPDAATTAFIRESSKTLFGNADVLQVAVAVARARDGIVNATDLSWELRIAVNRVSAQLTRLANAGLLVESPIADRKRWYSRVESPFWATCEWLYDTCVQHAGVG